MRTSLICCSLIAAFLAVSSTWSARQSEKSIQGEKNVGQPAQSLHPRPPKVEVQDATANEHEGYFVVLKVTNTNKEPLPYIGYVPSSFDPPIPEGRIEPIYKMEYWKQDQWTASPLGWCGTGIGPVTLPPEESVKFSVHVHNKEWDAVRIGISWREPKSKPSDSRTRTAWSPRIKLEDIQRDERRSR